MNMDGQMPPGFGDGSGLAAVLALEDDNFRAGLECLLLHLSLPCYARVGGYQMRIVQRV